MAYTDFDSKFSEAREQVRKPRQGSHTPPPNGAASDIVFTPVKWHGQPIPPREWGATGLVPLNNVTLLGGDGGLGKTVLAMQLQTAANQGVSWLGVEVKQMKSLGIYCEDDEPELHRRMADIAPHYACKLSDLKEMNLWSRVGQDNLLCNVDRREVIHPTAFYKDLCDRARDLGVNLIVLDSLHDLFGGNEISRPQVRQFIGHLRKLAIDINGAVVLCAHPSVAGMTSGTGTSGSTAWNNAVRSRLYLTRSSGEEADPDTRILKTMKSNYGPLGDEIELRWRDGVFVREVVDTSDPYGAAESVFLNCLAKVGAEGRYVSASPQSANFAPKTFTRMPQAKGCTKDKLRKAMDALFARGTIRVDEHRKSNRHVVEIIVKAVAA